MNYVWNTIWNRSGTSLMPLPSAGSGLIEPITTQAWFFLHSSTSCNTSFGRQTGSGSNFLSHNTYSSVLSACDWGKLCLKHFGWSKTLFRNMVFEKTSYTCKNCTTSLYLTKHRKITWAAVSLSFQQVYKSRPCWCHLLRWCGLQQRLSPVRWACEKMSREAIGKYQLDSAHTLVKNHATLHCMDMAGQSGPKDVFLSWKHVKIHENNKQIGVECLGITSRQAHAVLVGAFIIPILTPGTLMVPLHIKFVCIMENKWVLSLTVNEPQLKVTELKLGSEP